MMFSGKYPHTRMRRRRQAGWIRSLVAEHRLSAADLIYPAFVIEGKNTRQPVPSMPGVERLSIDRILEEARQCQSLGINALALFPVVEKDKKSDDGAEALNPGNLVCRAVQALKKHVPGIGLITDVALDPYTTHGHDGLLRGGKILNDETVDILTRQAGVLAEAGADIIAPSDMMDGRIGAIRRALDRKGCENTMILSYAAKYASGYYGPFREAVNSQDLLQDDKKTYQMDPANSGEALQEVALDLSEGADIVMVKPGQPYLDVICRVKNTFKVPVFAYHVSGEYAALKAASDKGWLDYETCLMETLTGFRRAGADAVLTYAAKEAARILSQE